MEQSTERVIEEPASLRRRPLKATKWHGKRFERLLELSPWSRSSCSKCIREQQLKAESILWGHRKGVEPLIRLLAAAAFSCLLSLLPLCVPTQTGLSRVSRHSRWAPARYTIWWGNCRSSSDTLRPTEAAFRLLMYCHRPHQIYDPWCLLSQIVLTALQSH
jgi:hypothetical protein